MTENLTSRAARNMVDEFITAREEKAISQKYQLMEKAIEEVLADSESKDGGWGPDVTMRAVLQEALTFDPLSENAL